MATSNAILLLGFLFGLCLLLSSSEVLARDLAEKSKSEAEPDHYGGYGHGGYGHGGYGHGGYGHGGHYPPETTERKTQETSVEKPDHYGGGYGYHHGYEHGGYGHGHGGHGHGGHYPPTTERKTEETDGRGGYNEPATK